MAVKSSGSPLSFSEIEAEFGQNSDRDLGEYRVSQTVGGLSNQPLDTGIPQSGAIKFSEFYDKRLNVIIDYHSGSTENRPTVAKTRYDAAAGTGTHTVIGGFATRPANSGGTKTRIHVNKTIGSSNSNVNNCAVRTGTGWNSGTVLTIEIGSSGKLYGAGGDGGKGGTSDSEKDGDNGGTGSSALGIQYSGTSVINNGSIIKGYGGGGGGGYRKTEEEEFGPGEVDTASGGGGGGGQGLPGGTGGGGHQTGGTGTLTAGGNGGNGEASEEARGGGGGGGGSNGTGGEGGASNDGGNGTSSSGGNGADATNVGSIEGENNVRGDGGSGGSSGAAIRRTSGITVNITNNATITGVTNATGVS